MRSALHARIFGAMLLVAGIWYAELPDQGDDHPPVQASPVLFRTGDACFGCHNGLVSSTGEDISIGTAWSASMMANAARDPYWQAAVRRETIDHPEAQQAIEQECSTCHMPMAHEQNAAAGQAMEVFAHVSGARNGAPISTLAIDGVSCTMCHQMLPDNFGDPASFTGGFVVDRTAPLGERAAFGPFAVDAGRVRVMHSATGFVQEQATHLQQSEHCATCHTLYTHAIGPDGETIGELPEQVPYLEWRHSAYRDEKSCQSCHMPVVEGNAPIASVLGQPHAGVSRHGFDGANFLMLRMLNRYRTELGVTALPADLESGVNRTLDYLREHAAHLSVQNVRLVGSRLTADVLVDNLAGHKLPTAYPSRRAWIHLTVRDRDGSTVFESGGIQPDGAIAGDDNDADGTRFEPHYTRITEPEQVQIYEAVMADASGNVTTGLLSAVRYVKDNRVLPAGFDKSTAEADIAVRGIAETDSDFTAGTDRVTYAIDVSGAPGPFSIVAVLRYQPVGFRWAQNLADYDSPETRRYVGYYQAMAPASAAVLAEASAASR